MSKPYRAWKRHPKGQAGLLSSSQVPYFPSFSSSGPESHATVNWAWNLGWHLRAVRLGRASRQQSGDLSRPFPSVCVSNSPTIGEHALTEPKGH